MDTTRIKISSKEFWGPKNLSETLVGYNYFNYIEFEFQFGNYFPSQFNLQNFKFQEHQQEYFDQSELYLVGVF